MNEDADDDFSIALPSGRRWTLEDALRKLTLRASLPGARVYDLCALGLRRSFSTPSVEDRFVLALPASWLVNSPASSVVMRRWALPPARTAWLSLIASLSASGEVFATGAWKDEVSALWPSLREEREEPIVLEAVSKVLALLVPERVPLMPTPARAFVLGERHDVGVSAFIAMVDAFDAAVRTFDEDLRAVAYHHAEVALTPGQVLDRLLWFDSEGHRHFEGPPAKTPEA